MFFCTYVCVAVRIFHCKHFHSFSLGRFYSPSQDSTQRTYNLQIRFVFTILLLNSHPFWIGREKKEVARCIICILWSGSEWKILCTAPHCTALVWKMGVFCWMQKYLQSHTWGNFDLKWLSFQHESSHQHTLTHTHSITTLLNTIKPPYCTNFINEEFSETQQQCCSPLLYTLQFAFFSSSLCVKFERAKCTVCTEEHECAHLWAAIFARNGDWFWCQTESFFSSSVFFSLQFQNNWVSFMVLYWCWFHHTAHTKRWLVSQWIELNQIESIMWIAVLLITHNLTQWTCIQCTHNHFVSIQYIYLITNVAKRVTFSYCPNKWSLYWFDYFILSLASSSIVVTKSVENHTIKCLFTCAFSVFNTIHQFHCSLIFWLLP